jgi:hypothetical protein
MRVPLFLWLSVSAVFSAAVVEHGPLVHWNQDPSKSCQIVWLERNGRVGEEGKWALGPAGFGYGDGDDATVFGRMKDRFLSVAIRTVVKPPADVPPNAVLVLRVNYDDGFIAWLGGREIARRNVSEKDGGTRAAGTHDAAGFENIPLGKMARFLTESGAVLALQGFNNNLKSSDFSLHATLVAKSGAKEWPLVTMGQAWEYLANAEPAEGWRTTTAGLVPESGGGLSTKTFDLRYRATGAVEWLNSPVTTQPFAGSSDQVLHSELKGLPAGKDIEFQIHEKAVGDSEIFRFRMPPQVSRPVRFVTGGDLYHSRGTMDRMNRRAGEEDPLFALIGGDLAYANDVAIERWFDYVDSWTANARTPDGRLLPKIVAIGNHETLGAGYHPNDAPGPEAARMFYSIFKFPEGKNATHTVDFGSWLSFVMLDSGHTKTIASQNAWLEGALQARRDVPNLFVAYHRPAWGSGVKEDSVEIQRDWCPLIERHRVTAVFEYDHHVFCRSHPIKGGVIDETNGIPYLGSGAWSVAVRPVDAKKLKKRPWVAASGAFNHIYLIETRDHGYTATAMDIDGKVIDRSERKWNR